jgi:hypothetical protein
MKEVHIVIEQDDCRASIQHVCGTPATAEIRAAQVMAKTPGHWTKCQGSWYHMGAGLKVFVETREIETDNAVMEIFSMFGPLGRGC